MKLRIRYTENNQNINVITSFVCVPDYKLKHNLQKNERYIDSSKVPESFYTRYYEFSLTGGELIWDERLYRK